MGSPPGQARTRLPHMRRRLELAGEVEAMLEVVEEVEVILELVEVEVEVECPVSVVVRGEDWC